MSACACVEMLSSLAQGAHRSGLPVIGGRLGAGSARGSLRRRVLALLRKSRRKTVRKLAQQNKGSLSRVATLIGENFYQLIDTEATCIPRAAAIIKCVK